ncbi:MAG: hydrogenase maturation nickel metallochaperone HypA [Desulfovibrio sp.]|jgi:hydrogenase nickel incorporation protein HypA/HybF|nr:hydrogenase maturation nickel metallochaperone HypA [Desulfovibrio sp.]
MHEMSIVESLLAMVQAEMDSRGCGRLESVHVVYGAMAGIVPESLQMCFEIMTKDTPNEGARLELTCLPVRLRCGGCGTVFGGEGREALWQPCPVCGETFGHAVEQGRELYLKRLEAWPA